MSAAPCFEYADFQRCLEGKLSAGEIEKVSSHIESCDRCTKVIQGMPETSLVGILRSAGRDWEPDTRSQRVQELIQSVLHRRARGWTVDQTTDEKKDGQAKSRPAIEAPPPSFIGRFKIVRLIGRGGMGTVYEAEDPELRRRVAVKVPQFSGSAERQAQMRQRFLREARTAAAVDHPNVCRIHDVGEHEGRPFVVMEFIEGQSLADWLDQNNHFTDRQAVALTIRIAKALQAVHGHGIVHRDLKPANILLRKDGSPVLTDFGLAHVREEQQNLTAEGTILGTPAYMAPEQVLSQLGPVSPRSDLYSLAVVLFQLLTGRLPAEGSVMETLYQLGHLQAPAPSRFRPDLDPALDAIIVQALARKPADRHADLNVFVEALQRWLLGTAEPAIVYEAELVTAAAVQPLPLRPRKSAHRIAWMMACGVMAMALVGVALASVVAWQIVIRIKGPGGKDTELVAPEGSRIEVDDKGGVALTLPGDKQEGNSPLGAKQTHSGNLPPNVQKRLATYCYRCHGQDGAVEGGFNYLLDREQLVAHKKVIPGQPDKSRLLERIAGGEMPPPEEKLRPSDEDVAVLRHWVQAGAPASDAKPTQAEFITSAQATQAVFDDLKKRNERSLRFTRYISLTHLHNAGLSTDELQTYRNGIAKLLNSLSWSKDIVVPTPVDVNKTILHIDLRDYNWQEREWETLLAQYPYGVDDGSELQKHIREATGTATPVLRGDWFVAVAARPPLYHDLLQLPRSDAELEKLLHVDVAANIRGERAVRAGFNNSGISRNNRLIERHETPYGAYWKSYDFKESAGAQNLFERPLGPGTNDRTFRHSGGEIIFNLPNGLQAYMLVNGQGSRIDKAPTEIVSDPKRPDRAVENGLSCMACHSRGINVKEDQVRAHVEKNLQAFSKEEAATILALYPPADKLLKYQQKDAARFQNAAAATGARVGNTEPILALALQYEASLSLRRAAAEVGLKAEEFQARLQKSPSLQRTLGSLQQPEESVPREVFAGAFFDLTKQWKLGKPAVATVAGATPGDGPPEIPSPRLQQARMDFKLPAPFSGVTTGGGGRYLVFQLKNAKKLIVFDVSEARIIHEIDLPTDDVRIAAGRDKLIILVPGQRLLQRWDLRTGKREKSVPIADEQPIVLALMGSYANGPLLLWIGGKAQLWDVDKMQPLTLKGDLLGHDPHWGFDIRVSADGQTFVSWHNSLTGQQFHVMRVQGDELIRLRSPDGHSISGFWTIPNADGTLFLRYDQKFYNGDMKVIEGDGFKDSVLVGTDDPRFFLALRQKDQDNVTICATADRRPVFTFKKLEEFPYIVNSRSRGWNSIPNIQTRIRYIPSANILVTLPPSDDRVIIRRFNLLDELEQSGKDYLVVLSNPISQAENGTLYTYPILAKSKAGGLRYNLESGPEGMTVSASGVVRWEVPERRESQLHRVIVAIQDAKCKEIQHAFEIKVLPPGSVYRAKTTP